MKEKRVQAKNETERARWRRKLKGVAMPLKLAGRTGTVRGAFWKAVTPHDEFSDTEMSQHVEAFLSEGPAPKCVYCGGEATDWDHLVPSRRKAGAAGKIFTGFGSLLSNLVPACGSCNQSKGSRHWRDWLDGESAHAHRARGNDGYDERVRRLVELERHAERDQRLGEEVTNIPEWIQYEQLLKEIGTNLRRADDLAALIRAAARAKK